MILEGFEIDNWSCIKHVAVGGLPPTGVIVLHGPNGTGKSSIIEAIRACLMDNKSTSKALERGFPKNSSAKPRVSVTFRTGGTTWRITKQFNSKDSKLERRTATGQWTLETADPSEAHQRTRQLTGGSDSALGLHQLLWLTQAEFRLPDPKKFDADVQSQLRSVLGVLQTPLDDRFLGRVKEEWSRWFGARSRPGAKPKLKKDCPLDKALAALERHQAELAAIEAEYQNFERLTETSGSLEVLSRDLRRQLEEKTDTRDHLQQEYERSLTRLEAHRLAAEHVFQAERVLADAQALRQGRADAAGRLREAKRLAEPASREVDGIGRRLQAAEQRLRDIRDELQALRDVGSDLQTRFNQVGERRRLLLLQEQAKTAGENLLRAEQTTGELEKLKKQARERPAPDAATVKRLEENRVRAGLLRADLEASAIALTLVPEPQAARARLSIDSAPAVEAGVPTNGKPIRCSVRRRAEIAIPGWGCAELTRGSDARSLDQIENDLNDLERNFGEGLAPFGIRAGDPMALDQLRTLVAERKVREPDFIRKQEEIDRLAPQGLDSLREEVAKLEHLLRASASALGSPPTLNCLPAAAGDLDQLVARLTEQIDATNTRIRAAEEQMKGAECEIDGVAAATVVMTGLRKQEANAKEKLTTLNATVEVLRSELERLLTTEQVGQKIRNAEAALCRARGEFETAKLSESEETIRERLDASNDGLRALQGQLAAAEKEFHRIEGALRLTEGLHQKRAAAAARVDELTRETEREMLQSESFDRLYALFEECREKQLGAVMGPIHDRVLRWMRLLRIGGYQSIRFNDQFLPETLIAGDGATELLLREESTGTIEQIALMVRLALGATLSTAEEPVVAVLDDPLTHSDVVRLDRMRAVLKNACAGDVSLTPPAGPLQIVVFTCHPEWFAMDGAMVIDLSKLDVLSKSC